MTIKYQFTPKETVYFGIENKSTLIPRSNLADLISIPYLEPYYIMREFHHEGPNNYGNTPLPYYYYKIVDKSGERTSIPIGDFEITEICPEVNYFGRLDTRDIKVYDKKLNVYHTFPSKQFNETFITKELLLLVEKLKVIPDWDTLMEYLKIPDLKKKIQDLTQELNTLKEKVNSQGQS